MEPEMNSLADVFRKLNQLREAGVVGNYAIGGAMATLFYAEPTRTYDLDVFVLLPQDASSKLVSLDGIYQWARSQEFALEAEHVLIHGVPVQFLPAHNELVEEAIDTARELAYEGVPVRVVDPERLVALAVQAGGARRRERAWQLIELGDLDRALLRSILSRHNLVFEIPADV
jgi:hypothetical protein